MAGRNEASRPAANRLQPPFGPPSLTTPEQQSALRILDANANRAAEALRVAEDFCRFHWNLPGFAAELKALRHDVLGLLRATPEARQELLRERDIDGDVGRATASPASAAPPSAAEIALRNVERAKEALRTLEEASRICRPGATRALEELRYRLYSIERGLAALPPQSAVRERLERVSLYLVASSEACERRTLVDGVKEAVEAGCAAVQLREKNLGAGQILQLARTLREVTARRGALFVVNDRPDIARLAHADGVHIGQDDLPLPETRRLVGDDMLVGVSTHNLEQAREAVRQGADYIGVGPVFATRTKNTADPLLGPRGLERILEATGVPAFAIGGITAERLVELRQHCPGLRVAACGAILGAEAVGEAVRALGSLPRP